MNKISLIKSKIRAIYVKKSFVWIKMMKIIKIKERLKITVIIQENVIAMLNVMLIAMRPM